MFWTVYVLLSAKTALAGMFLLFLVFHVEFLAPKSAHHSHN